MRTLIFGAGPLGSLYAHLLGRAGNDVTLLARGRRFESIQARGVVVVDELTGAQATTKIRVVDGLQADDSYDLVIVLIRKNKLEPVFEILAAHERLEAILFMGNNALGFGEYLRHLPAERVLFGFPGAGGGIRDQTVHYVDRQKVGAKRESVTLGEIDGRTRARTRAIVSWFETSQIPVDLTPDIDGWLKYHAALVLPLATALYKHDCDNRAVARDPGMLRMAVRAAKESGRVLRALGYRKRQPFRFNLFYWLPEVLSVRALRSLLESRFADVAFALHAEAARDEMRQLAAEFQSLVAETSVETPNLDRLERHLG